MSCLSPNLAVQSVPETLKYYTDILGFEVGDTHPPASSNKTPVWASIKHGDKVKFMISTQDMMEEEYKETKTEKLGGGITLYFTVNDVDEYFKTVMGKGVEILKKPEVMFYAMKEFSIRDVNGFVLTFGSVIKDFSKAKMLGENREEKNE